MRLRFTNDFNFLILELYRDGTLSEGDINSNFKKVFKSFKLDIKTQEAFQRLQNLEREARYFKWNLFFTDIVNCNDTVQ